MAISALRPADSPRSAGEDEEHAQRLAEADQALPPILVHRSTMRIIDGMHRVRAAKLKGAQDISVRYFEGSDVDAFVAGVRANVEHGLPLNSKDRQAAAKRILRSRPEWSDRSVAKSAGLSDKTVAAIRSRLTSEIPQLPTRTGSDGRMRPLDSTDGRRRARDLLVQQPNLSLRSIAKAAGISVRTAKDVRDRLSRGEDPVPPSSRQSSRATENAGRAESRDLTVLLVELQNDPSLRYSESGRRLLRGLGAGLLTSQEFDRVAETAPPYVTEKLAAAAAACAEIWRTLAEDLSRRASDKT
ncbi:ParB/RepB/Spo0J family partition protein [Amycolatopsis circi]|uniref:ParB/RepB/Spo0J family partition protein n=1 Tax=Amycolatopsis circi TaxID=871959 RepID=UPI001FC9412C|nr:ParB N-terminal domain-containing protein [Amycolatopsis circi]